MKKYDDTSIKTLKGAERVRSKPSIMFGSDDIEGCCHSVFEILSNSVDEAREGYGKTIVLTKYMDNSISVQDEGRGIPLDYNKKEERYNYELLFCEMYAGSKYDNNSEGTYKYSLGTHGLGLCITQYASEYMDVEVFRQGYKYNLHFEKGEIASDLKKTKIKSDKTGTFIKWRPDIEVFTDIIISNDILENMMKKQAIINKGIKFILNIETNEGFVTSEYFYENGITEYVQELTGGNNLSEIRYITKECTGKDREDKKEYRVKMEIAYTFSNKSSISEYYHNSSPLEHGGSPDKAVKNAFTSSIDTVLKKLNKYSKNSDNINTQDILDSLIVVTSSFSTETSYENQTKKSIKNKFIQEAMTEFLKDELEVFFIENPIDTNKILDQILINKKARESAENTKTLTKKKLSETIGIKNKIEKFVDCRTKDTSKREVFIVEGDSALGSIKLARDSGFQAVMPIRGKILNCLKVDTKRIFQSDIITDLVKVLGCGVEVSSKNSKVSHFNIDNLRWDKVIICTDADVDGFQIRTLVLTMIYRLMPTLIEEGKVYIVETPLYQITAGKKTYFAYDDKEKASILSKIKGSYKIERSKGLGENDPQMMWDTTMNPENRRLIKIKMEDAKSVSETFSLLLGNNLAGRKAYIKDNGSLYLDEVDIF